MANYSRQIEFKSVIDVITFRGLAEEEKHLIDEHFPTVGVLMNTTQGFFPEPFEKWNQRAARKLYTMLMSLLGIKLLPNDGSFDHLTKLHKQRSVKRYYYRN